MAMGKAVTHVFSMPRFDKLHPTAVTNTTTVDVSHGLYLDRATIVPPGRSNQPTSTSASTCSFVQNMSFSWKQIIISIAAAGIALVIWAARRVFEARKHTQGPGSALVVSNVEFFWQGNSAPEPQQKAEPTKRGRPQKQTSPSQSAASTKKRRSAKAKVFDDDAPQHLTLPAPVAAPPSAQALDLALPPASTTTSGERVPVIVFESDSDTEVTRRWRQRADGETIVSETTKTRRRRSRSIGARSTEAAQGDDQARTKEVDDMMQELQRLQKGYEKQEAKRRKHKSNGSHRD